MAATRWAAGGALVLLLSAAAPAQILVTVPNIYESTNGPGVSSILIAPQNNPWTVQLIWNANQLTGLVGTQITGITYRLNAVTPNGYPRFDRPATTWADYRISLGPSVTPNLATGTFAANYLSAPTLVRSGPLTVGPNAWPTGGSGSTPDPWGVEITFDTSYLYTGGPLALLVSHPGSDNPDPGNALLDSTTGTSPGISTDFTMIAANSFNATTGASSVFATIVRLTATPVPEPSGLALLAAAAGLAATVRRWRRGSGVAAVAACVLLGPAGRARADVIINNFPGNDAGGSFLNAPAGGALPGQVQGSKAAGFTMPAGDDYTLSGVQLRLTLFDRTTVVPVIAIYDTNAAGKPGTPLVTLTNPDFAVLQMPTDYTFTPPAPFTLSHGATYWIVASNNAVAANSYLWLASTPPVTPTGIATSAGFLFDNGPPPPVTPSTSVNTYAVIASPVPEPSTLMLTGLAAAGLLGCARGRRAATSQPRGGVP